MMLLVLAPLLRAAGNRARPCRRRARLCPWHLVGGAGGRLLRLRRVAADRRISLAGPGTGRVLAAGRPCHRCAGHGVGGAGLPGGLQYADGGQQSHALRLACVPELRGGLGAGDDLRAAGVPPDPAARSGARARRLRATVRDEALALLRGGHARPEAWQQRQQHRVAQLGALLKSRPAPPVRGAGAEPCRDAPGPRGAAHPARAAPPRTARRRAARGHAGPGAAGPAAGPPSRAAVHAKRTARLLERHADAASPLRAQVQKVMAAFADIHALARGHAAYFDAESPREPEAC